jgi:hypothetical protein
MNLIHFVNLSIKDHAFFIFDGDFLLIFENLKGDSIFVNNTDFLIITSSHQAKLTRLIFTNFMGENASNINS